MSDSTTEGGLHPQSEILAGVAPGGFDQTQDALVGGFGWEVAQVVLEGIGHPFVLEADVRRPLVLVHLVAHGLFEEFVELPEVAEDDMTTEVPGESLGVHHRSGMSTGDCVLFGQHPVCVSESPELAGTAQAAGPRSYDHNSRRIGHRALFSDL